MSSKYGLQRHTDSSLKSRQIEEREGVHYLLAQRASERARSKKRRSQDLQGTRGLASLWKYSARSHLIPYPPSPAVHGIMVNRHSPARRSSTIKAQFSYPKILQNFSDFPSHRIFRHMYEALNIDKKI
jgi:hypothetical protein